MKKFVLPLVAGCLLAAGVSHAQAAMPVAKAGLARLDVVYQNCLKGNAAASVAAAAKEKPPTDARGQYANKGKCQGCSLGWWQTTQPAVLYAEPDAKSRQTATVPAGIWVYAVDIASLTVPRRGIVVKAGGAFKRCDTVYHVYTNQEEGETWDTVWRQGELFTNGDGDEDAIIRWTEEELKPAPDIGAGWWTRLLGLSGEAGWAWVLYRGDEFKCRWKQDPEDVCTSAPKEPPPGLASSH